MKSPAFQFYPQDFLVGTADMTAEEVGGYIRLLCYQWAKGGLPNDDLKLAVLAGCHGNAITSIRHKFGIGKDGLLRNERLETVRDEQKAYKQRQADNASKGWQKRHNRMPSQCDGNATASPSHMPDACSSPSSSPSPSIPLSIKETEPEPIVTPPIDPNWPKRIREIHGWYSEQMGGGIRLDGGTEAIWFNWFKVGFEEDDFKRVLKYLRAEIDSGNRNPGAIKLTNLLQPETFNGEMAALKFPNANRSKTHQRGNPRLEGVSRNNTVNDYAAASKRKLERQMAEAQNGTPPQTKGTGT